MSASSEVLPLWILHEHKHRHTAHGADRHKQTRKGNNRTNVQAVNVRTPVKVAWPDSFDGAEGDVLQKGYGILEEELPWLEDLWPDASLLH